MARSLLLVACLAALATAVLGRRDLAQSMTGAAPPQCSTVYQTLSSNPDLSSLLAAVDAAGLQATLDDPALVATIFAPSNKAFERVARDSGTTPEAILSASPELLRDILSYHVIPQVAVTAADLKAGLRFTMLNGQPILIETQRIKPDPKYAGCNSFDIHIDTFIDEDPEPLVCDIQACSAVVHISDYVFIPNNPQIRQLLPEADLKAQLSG